MELGIEGDFFHFLSVITMCLIVHASIVSCQDYHLYIERKVLPLSKHHVDLRICFFMFLRWIMCWMDKTNVQNKGFQGLSRLMRYGLSYQSGLHSFQSTTSCIPQGYLSLILGKISEPAKSSPRSSEAHSCGWGCVRGHTKYAARKISMHKHSSFYYNW